MVPSIIGIFVFCSLGKVRALSFGSGISYNDLNPVGGIATTVCSTILSDFSQLESFKGAVITWLAASAIADILITTTLVLSLVGETFLFPLLSLFPMRFCFSLSQAKRRTGHRGTDDAIDRIIRRTSKVLTSLIKNTN